MRRQGGTSRKPFGYTASGQRAGLFLNPDKSPQTIAFEGRLRVIKQALAANGFRTALDRHTLTLRSSYINFMKIHAPTKGRSALSWDEEGMVALQWAKRHRP